MTQIEVYLFDMIWSGSSRIESILQRQVSVLMPESTSWQGMKSATPNQCKTTVLRQMKFQENIHKDKTLWSCNIRKKLQEALEYTDKILAAGL